MLLQYSIVGIVFLGAIGFAAFALGLSRLAQTHRPYPEKTKTYECGMAPIGKAWVRFKVSYFLCGLIFLIFDVETLFLYPWALQFQQLGLFAIIEMFVFILILVVGLWYAWKEGALEWQ